MKEMIRRISYEDHADKWLYFKEGNDYGVNWSAGVDFGPLFSKRTIEKWLERGEVVGHRKYDNVEEWSIIA